MSVILLVFVLGFIKNVLSMQMYDPFISLLVFYMLLLPLIQGGLSKKMGVLRIQMYHPFISLFVFYIFLFLPLIQSGLSMQMGVLSIQMYHSFSSLFVFFFYILLVFLKPFIQGGLKHHEEEVVSYFSDDPGSVMITNIPSRCVHS